MRFSGLAAQMLNHRLQLVKFFEGFQVADYGVFQVALRLLMGLAKYGHGEIFRDAVKNSLFLPYSAQNRDFHDNFGGLLFPQESHDHISLRPTRPLVYTESARARHPPPELNGRCTSQRFPGELVTAGRSHRSHLALTANIGGVSRFTCWARTSFAVNSATNSSGAAAFSTLALPPASSRSTRHNTPAISNPNSRAASMAWMVEAPVVQTSSTMTTRAGFCRKPSMRWPMPCAFSALRTKKPCTGFPCCALITEVATTMGSAPMVSPPIASARQPRWQISSKTACPGDWSIPPP